MQPTRPSASSLRALPAVGRVQASRAFRKLAAEIGATLATELVREELARAREGILRGSRTRAARAVTPGALVQQAARAARTLLARSPVPVINATGVVIHTNLGRSILSEAAARRVAESAALYMDLEYDLDSARRGSRGAHLEPLLARLFPGRSAAAFNNNAAAILIALRTLARGKEVVVSRGELVEIGGSFRIPDILAASGARLAEVGTTNRTRLEDYERALSKRSAILLKVHTSNFQIVGFTEQVAVRPLAELARKAGLPLVVDWGSGDLVDLRPLGIPDELPVREILEQGADLVTFSADKLLGGPQAGIAVGSADLVTRLKKDPLARVCRLDRLLVCALQETLAAYVRGKAFEEIPTLRMLSLAPEEIGRRAAAVLRSVSRRAGIVGRVTLMDGVSRTGGGSSPMGERPTRLLAIEGREGDAGRIEEALRSGTPPVIGRMQGGRLLLDLRTVLPAQDARVAARLAEALRAEAKTKL